MNNEIQKEYTSKTKRNECKNEDCTNIRQHSSSRCLDCSRKFNKKNKNMIKIFSTPTCHYCEEAKKFFLHNNFAFTEYNVQDDLIARKEMMDISGSRSVPVITVGDKYMIGWNEQEFNELTK